MGVFSSQGTEGQRGTRRTIWSTFSAMVAVPVACLVVLWGLVLALVIGGAIGGPDTPHHDHEVVVDFVVVIGIGLVIVVVGATMMGLFARRLARDVTGLQATAQHLADEEMPALIERLRRGDQEPMPEPALPRLHTKTAEIAQAEAAITSLQHTAAVAATGEARLRNGIRQVFVSLARRNQSLLQRQLRLIDALEQKASDPATLADLFPLDHLTTRMRRHAEGLIILSGAAPGRSWSEPVPVIDVIRGAVAEVEDYKRVTVLTRAEDAVAGLAAADMIHLLAELIENATLSSPSGTRVEVRAERVANGFAIEIDDRGLGIEAGQLRTINQQLAKPPDFDLANADQLGLFVVGKLAARHAVRVALRPSPYGGTTAVALMPNSIVVPANETDTDTNPDLRPGTDRMSGLDLDHADALALTGRRPAQPSLPEGTTRRTEAPDDLFGPGRDPVPAVPPPSFRLGTPPPRLGTTGLAGPGPGTPGLAPPRPGTPELAPPGPGTPGLAPPGQGTPPPPLPRRSTPGLAPPGPGREEPAAADPDPFGLRGPAADPDPFGLRGPAADPDPFGLRGPAADPDPFGLRGPAADPTPTPTPIPAADADADPGAAPGPQTAGTYRGLPRRIRQASLNPHLRDSSRAAARGADADRTPPSVARSPEEARSLVASLQSGWQRGRESDVPDGEPADTAQGTGRQDSEAPRGEETLWMSRDWPGQASS
jgi:signal transduction histidine kinase